MAAVKLSKILIIVIAVSGLIGCIVILFLVFRCCRRPKSTPLPPIQPLAHHREKELNHLPHPRIPHISMGLTQPGRYGSDTSLLKPSREPSFQTDESLGVPSSSHHSLLVPPSPSTNATHQSSPLSAESQSDGPPSITHQYLPTTRPARSTSRTRSRQPRSRMNSTVSTHSNTAQTSTRSPNAIRGAPHSTLNNVQIVLPTPLAPQLQNHMVTTPSVVGSHEDPVERGGIADGWTPTPSRTTSRRSNANLTQDASRGRKTSSSSGHRYHRSLDTMDQPRGPESQTQFRGRSSSSRSIQPQPHGDIALSPGSLDNRTRPPRAILRKPRDGQAGQPPSEGENRSSNSHSRSRSRPRSHQSLGNTSNVPFPQSASLSLHPYTPSSSANTLTHHSAYNGLSPPPVPPLPRLSQNSLTQAETTSSRRLNSITGPNDFNGASTRAIDG